MIRKKDLNGRIDRHSRRLEALFNRVTDLEKKPKGRAVSMEWLVFTVDVTHYTPAKRAVVIEEEYQKALAKHGQAYGLTDRTEIVESIPADEKYVSYRGPYGEEGWSPHPDAGRTIAKVTQPILVVNP